MNAGHPTITIDLVRTADLTSQPTMRTKGKEQVLDRLQTKEVLRAMLHSILFHRLFGTVKPQTFEVLDVTMVRVCSRYRSRPSALYAGQRQPWRAG